MALINHGLAVTLLGAVIAGGSGLDILSSMNVRFIVVDPAGRRTGYDSVTGNEVSEIPSSRYGVISISIYREPVSEDFNIRSAIRAGEHQVYHLIYAGDPSVPIRIDTAHTEGFLK